MDGDKVSLSEETLREVRTDADASLLQFLPSKRGLGLVCIMLIHFLAETQNRLLRAVMSDEVDLKSVSNADVLAYNEQDVLSLILRHSSCPLQVSSVSLLTSD